MVILSGGNCVRVPISNKMEVRGRHLLVNRKLIPLSQKQVQAIVGNLRTFPFFSLRPNHARLVNHGL